MFQIHSIAAYLAVATPILLDDIVTLIAAPIVLPFYWFGINPAHAALTWVTGRELFGNDLISCWIATHLFIRYLVFLLPSYFLARDFRYRALTIPVYILAVLLIVGWPIFQYWFRYRQQSGEFLF